MSTLNHEIPLTAAQRRYRRNREHYLRTFAAQRAAEKDRKQECQARHPYDALLARLAALPASHIDALRLSGSCAGWACHAATAPGMAVCAAHWAEVPNHIRDEIFAVAREAVTAGPFRQAALILRLVHATDCAIRAVQHREDDEL